MTSGRVAHLGQHDAPIGHAGDDRTVEAGALVTLDGTASWHAGERPLALRWTRIGGPDVALDTTHPERPVFRAPVPGEGGVPAEDQVVVFTVVRYWASWSTSTPATRRAPTTRPIATSGSAR